MNVTREVIADLLPLYDAGGGSASTRALVEEFLAQDSGLARTRAARARSVRRGFDVLLFTAILFSAFAVGRVVADTTWDNSPAGFIAMALVATVLWVAFCVRMTWMRRERVRAS